MSVERKPDGTYRVGCTCCDGTGRRPWPGGWGYDDCTCSEA